MNDPSQTPGTDVPQIPPPSLFVPHSPELPPPLAADAAEPGPILLLVNAAQDPIWAADSAIAIASNWARAGRRVVLADLHFEEPILHTRLGESNLEGVVDIFLYGASVARSARPPRDYSFFLIPAGTYTAAPEDVYGHPRWSKLVAGFREAGATLLAFVPASAPGVEMLSQYSDGAVLLGRAQAAVTSALSVESVRAVLVPSLDDRDSAPDAADEHLADEERLEAEERARPDGDAATTEPATAEPTEIFPDEADAPGGREDVTFSAWGDDALAEARADELAHFEAAIDEPEAAPADETSGHEPDEWSLDPAATQLDGGRIGESLRAAPAELTGELAAGAVPEGDAPRARQETEQAEEAVQAEARAGARDFGDAEQAEFAPAEDGDERAAGSIASEPPEPAVQDDTDWARGPGGSGAPPAAAQTAQRRETEYAPEEAIAGAVATETGEAGARLAPPAPQPLITPPRRKRRGGPGPMIWLLVGAATLVLAVLVAAMLRPDLFGGVRGPAGGDSARDTVAAGARVPAAPMTPVPTGDTLAYAVQVRAYASLPPAQTQLERQARRVPDAPFYIVPELTQGVLYYKVMAGTLRDSAAGAALRQRLVDAGVIAAEDARDDAFGSWSLIQARPLTYQLGEFATRDEAATHSDSLSARGIPSYAVALRYSDGAPRWRVYGGAYADSIQAAEFGRLLREAELPVRLVPRLGLGVASMP
jgi:hypothetical protein